MNWEDGHGRIYLGRFRANGNWVWHNPGRIAFVTPPDQWITIQGHINGDTGEVWWAWQDEADNPPVVWGPTQYDPVFTDFLPDTLNVGTWSRDVEEAGVDNLYAFHTVIPEPATLGLLALGGLLMLRRR